MFQLFPILADVTPVSPAAPFIIETSPLKKIYQARDGAPRPTGTTSSATAPAAQSPAGPGFVSYPALQIPRGGLIAILGTSGVGKSTLLNLLAGLDEPTPVQGEKSCWIKLNLAGPDGAYEPVDIVANHKVFPRHRIGFVFQQGHLLSNATVGFNIGLPGIVHAKALAGLNRHALGNQGIEDLLRDLKVEPAAEIRLKRAYQLSGGQAQRVAFARAIAHNPDIIFADEPTSGLDDANARGLLGILKSWLAQDPNRTVLWVTHSEQLAYELADRQLLLTPGASDGYVAARFQDPPYTPPNPGVEYIAALNKPSQLDQPASAPADGSKLLSIPPLPMSITSLAARFATSEMCSEREALKRGDQQLPLSRRLAHFPALASRPPGLLAALPAMRSAFRDWRTAILFLLSGLLLFISLAGLLVNWRLAESALADPLSCRMELYRRSGQSQRSFDRTEVEQTLAARPWLGGTDEDRSARLRPLTGFSYAPATCTSGPGMFGRITELGWGLGGVIDGKCHTDHLVDARILVAPRNEPMFAKVLITASDAGKKPSSLYDLLFDQNTFPANDLFVTADRYESLAEKLKGVLRPGQKLDELCLVEGQDDVSIATATRLKFKLTAKVDEIAAGGKRRYDAFMPDDVHQRWKLQLGAKLPDFDQAVVYFHPGDHEKLAAFLDDKSNGEFAFNREDLSKARERLYVSWASLVSIGLLCSIIIIILGSYLLNWFEYYLEVNEKPLSVLVAYGVGRNLLKRVVLLRALTNLVIGLLVVLVPSAALAAIVMLAWPWVLANMSIDPAWLVMTGRFGDLVSADDVIKGGCISFAIMALVVWLMSRSAVNRWYERNRYVAPLLA